MRAAALALALALAACTSPTGGGGDGDPLPMIAIDPCPAPADLLAPAERPARGRRLPDVALPCLGHPGEVEMRAVGKVPTVVNLWASWCFPCRTEMPEFQQVHVALGDRVRFLGVDTKDFERPARSAIQDAAVSYASVFDKDERIGRAINARSYPATVLVGADGLVKDVHIGALTAAELRDLIEQHLGVA